MASPLRADLFCRVIDNYGDIGVCWRLARRLAHGRGWQVRLWVDDLHSFARLESSVDPTLAQQSIQGLDIIHWTDVPPDLTPGDAVIETFACDPPAQFVARMTPGKQAWINLEYLSAEPWVESCHGLPSLQANGLSKHFFFPGFTHATGGLLREPTLLAERNAWQADAAAQTALLTRLGVPQAAIQAWQDGARLCTLFCYPDAPIDALLHSLSQASPAVVLVPHGVTPSLTEGQHGRVQVVRIPFMPQPDFDRLLWSADLNLVRGEDSFVRALWAARPMLWHIYAQEQNAHLDKLNAWLSRYSPPGAVASLMQAWNQADDATDFASLLITALEPNAWRAWRDHACIWSNNLARQTDLADALADFCEPLIQPRATSSTATR